MSSVSTRPIHPHYKPDKSGCSTASLARLWNQPEGPRDHAFLTRAKRAHDVGDADDGAIPGFIKVSVIMRRRAARLNVTSTPTVRRVGASRRSCPPRAVAVFGHSRLRRMA